MHSFPEVMLHPHPLPPTVLVPTEQAWSCLLISPKGCLPVKLPFLIHNLLLFPLFWLPPLYVSACRLVLLFSKNSNDIKDTPFLLKWLYKVLGSKYVHLAHNKRIKPFKFLTIIASSSRCFINFSFRLIFEWNDFCLMIENLAKLNWTYTDIFLEAIQIADFLISSTFSC